MTWQYHYDQSGKAIGVFIPMEVWNSLQEKYEEFAVLPTPNWQDTVLDKRLELLATNPKDITSLDDFLIDLNERIND
jgi:hypothetical protein